jgi:hypothetical protein
MAHELSDMPSMIEEVIRRELGSDRVRRVLISQEIGSDEEPVVRVFVVYGDREHRPKAADMLKTLRAVSGQLKSHDIPEPALISYISSSEADDLEARTH